MLSVPDKRARGCGGFLSGGEGEDRRRRSGRGEREICGGSEGKVSGRAAVALKLVFGENLSVLSFCRLFPTRILVVVVCPPQPCIFATPRRNLRTYSFRYLATTLPRRHMLPTLYE